jgi:hypothetical protein
VSCDISAAIGGVAMVSCVDFSSLSLQSTHASFDAMPMDGMRG